MVINNFQFLICHWLGTKPIPYQKIVLKIQEKKP